MAGYVRKGTGDAEGRRIGAELGLGAYLEGWNGSELKGRVVLGWILIGIAVLGGIGGVLETMHQSAAAEQQALSGAVHTGHRGGKRAVLAGHPNDFLAGYVLERAARRVGVPFKAW